MNERTSDEDLKLLKEEFPSLYENVYCGYSCGRGWFNIIRRLSLVLEPLGIKCHQAKEKFGSLRFYVGYPEDISLEDEIKAEVAIYEAGRWSDHTCELCGERGERRIDLRWIKTLCKDHYDEVPESARRKS
jgi:hypothetical protein